MLNLSPARIEALEQLLSEQKFGPNSAHVYFGAPNEVIRTRCQSRIDEFLRRLLASLPENPTKSHVLAEMSTALSTATGEDTDEQDETASYMERVLDILGIDSSDGLLNNWRYGFDPIKAP